jgi:hypothetical protein
VCLKETKQKGAEVSETKKQGIIIKKTCVFCFLSLFRQPQTEKETKDEK